MAKIRSVTEIAQKWARVAPTRTEDYTAGVQNPKEDWQRATEAAKDNWKQAITQAAQKGSFEKGVRAAGTAKWQRKAIEVGSRRWPEGVSVAQPDYEAGFAPYVSVIQATQLPPRYPKGDPRNLERVKAIAMALRKKKEGS